jgi:octaprenyl-diphosphate synthase
MATETLETRPQRHEQESPPMPVVTSARRVVSRSLEALYRPVAADLAEAERVFDRELNSSAPYVKELVAHLAHYRGKRLRPALLLLTARACGLVAPEHHTLAAVVEMIHTATLVHDDVLDGADLRRHVPTVNAKWGNSSSVLLGDLLFTHAFYLASTTGSTLACRLIGEATNRVCEGELQQIGEQGNLALTESEYFTIIDGKTAELTACACRLGAVFSGAGEAVVESLTRYGRDLGVAFQIADDVLDLVGQEGEVGKSLGTDLKQQKLTLPLIRLLQVATGEQSRRFQALLQAPEAEARVALQRLLGETDALPYATRRAEERAARARRELACLPPSESRQILEELTALVVHRSS